MSFVTIMKKVAQDIKVAFEDVVKYLPAAAPLAALLFPEAAGAIAAGTTVVDLIQKTVVTVEQKFAAAGNPTGSGEQKLASVVSIVSPAVLSLLTTEKVPVDSTRITAIVNAVVAILNAQTIPGA